MPITFHAIVSAIDDVTRRLEGLPDPGDPDRVAETLEYLYGIKTDLLERCNDGPKGGFIINGGEEQV